MQWVYLWKRFHVTGHVSVRFGDDYLSFHPIDLDWVEDIRGTPGYLGSYAGDLELSGPPVKTIPINWLNEDLMSEKMEEYRSLEAGGNLRYYLLSQNCAALAMELLCCGAREAYGPYKSLMQIMSSFNRMPFRHDHTRMLEYAGETFEDMALHCGRRGKVGSFGKFLGPALLTELVTRMFVWSPGDVDRFARGLEAKNH